MSDRRMVRAGGVELCVETFGDAAHPAVLLISGSAASMDWWDDDLCRRLAEAGRYVIRYDHRDTGESVAYPAGAPGYTGDDLVTDALGVLDALGLARAHVVGISMGGGIAQHIGVEHPGRVLSLTLMSTSPDGRSDEPLPPVADRVLARFEHPPPDPEWADREAVIARIVDDEQVFAGSIPPDEARLRALAARVYDRTRDPAAPSNHWILEGGGEGVRRRFGEIAAPTLVVHGTDDPLFPLPHGEALAREIPGARLLVLEGMGHQVPPPELWDVFVPALVEHTA